MQISQQYEFYNEQGMFQLNLVPTQRHILIDLMHLRVLFGIYIGHLCT